VEKLEQSFWEVPGLSSTPAAWCSCRVSVFTGIRQVSMGEAGAERLGSTGLKLYTSRLVLLSCPGFYRDMAGFHGISWGRALGKCRA